MTETERMTAAIEIVTRLTFGIAGVVLTLAMDINSFWWKLGLVLMIGTAHRRGKP